MPLRHLIRMLANEQVIRKLSESYPMRRAAQLTAYFIHKGKEIGEDRLEKMKESDMVNRMRHEGEKLKESDMVNRMKHEGGESMQKGKETFNRSVKRTNSFFIRFFNAVDEEWKKAKKPIEEERAKQLRSPPSSRRERRRKDSDQWK